MYSNPGCFHLHVPRRRNHCMQRSARWIRVCMAHSLLQLLRAEEVEGMSVGDVQKGIVVVVASGNSWDCRAYPCGRELFARSGGDRAVSNMSMLFWLLVEEEEEEEAVWNRSGLSSGHSIERFCGDCSMVHVVIRVSVVDSSVAAMLVTVVEAGQPVHHLRCARHGPCSHRQ
ncbi:hypothetical protein BAUCODRAFT_331904 [Baudoinia panamericana UAMH 10762]|uniref:Uncharacterized protein n=1 Tax=Baudoinia panamericana (strain UAMH 10762) TaxID=717646 RepID=M2MI42_BAUPA|nr:uncharacterized protein BAUCODRAFT_331904 [Baudoinia panamericana UAMH 10762]EMC90933.1 hypothetical protein BAUCODRAFT_331904 [Baudoinia panamericana UAMH 10762]